MFREAMSYFMIDGCFTGQYPLIDRFLVWWRTLFIEDTRFVWTRLIHHPARLWIELRYFGMNGIRGDQLTK
jgi:hypothetical protein